MVTGEPGLTFYLGSTLTLLEGLSYVTVGLLLARRPVPSDLAVPARMFQAWWLLIGANKLLSALAGLGAAERLVSDQVYVAIIYLNVIVLCLSLWSLLSHLAYVRRGPPAIRAWIVGLYVAYYFLLTYHITAGDPQGAAVAEWRTTLVSNNPSVPLRQLLTLLFLVLPQLVGAIMYFALLFRVADRSSRFRILLVSLSIVAWTASILMVAMPGFDESPGLQVSSRFVGILAALMGLIAYFPPHWLRRRLGVQAVPAAL